MGGVDIGQMRHMASLTGFSRGGGSGSVLGQCLLWAGSIFFGVDEGIEPVSDENSQKQLGFFKAFASESGT